MLVKTTEGSSLLSRARAFMGPTDLHDYTVEADVLATTRRGRWATRASSRSATALTLFGNGQKLELTPWQPETCARRQRPVRLEDGHVVSREAAGGEPAGRTGAGARQGLAGRRAEPAAWMVERADPIGNRQGSPGIFGSALAEIYFDNVKVYANK